MLEILAFNPAEELEEFGNVGNITIRDPNKRPTTSSRYCIGFKFVGTDLTNPEHWIYDHTNYWVNCKQSLLTTNPKPVSRSELDAALRRHTSVEQLLRQYLDLIKQGDRNP